jgi:6-phosphogluconolactonase (cycloisomerase 2 family)
VHLSIDPTGRWIITANYSAGSVGVVPIEKDGTLGPRADLVTLTGEPRPDGKRQTSSHRHDAVFDPSGPFLAVPDLGFDRIFVFRLDAESGKLNPNDPPFAKTRPGRRPQAHRLSSADAVRLCDQRTRFDRYHLPLRSAAGQLAADPGLAIHSGELQRRQHGAEIAVAPSGRVVYASNRGHDTSEYSPPMRETGP